MACGDYTVTMNVTDTAMNVTDTDMSSDGSLVLQVDPAIECCSSQHVAMMAVSLLCLLYYVSTCLLIAPFMLADSDGILGGEGSDVGYPACFVLQGSK